MERKLFKTGNSLTVTIPPSLAAELGFRPGDLVELDIDREHDGLLVRRTEPTASDESPVTPGFAEWVDGFIDRYGDALQKLRKR
jgi:bifunctional DNA-binding transcriptional regulator/antitoxin component of YhaV-PrlF toxin-antitoxin module